MATTVSADRPRFLRPREEDRPGAGSPSLSQRQVSIDGLACEPSQVLAGLRPCPWWDGTTADQRQLLSRYPCPVIMTKACIFMR